MNETRVFLLNAAALEGREGVWLTRLSPYRRARAERSLFVRGRTLSLAAGALLDLALQRYGLRERDMQYGFGENGKPFFRNAPALHFNLSHTEQFVLLALGGEEVGCDIEYIRPIRFHLAERYFSPEERAWMQAEDTQRRFFRVWTAKESYLKAVGGSIAYLSAVTVDLDQHIVCGADGWFLHEYELDTCAAACCARGDAFAPLCDLTKEAKI